MTGTLFLLGAVLLWGLGAPLSRVAFDAGLTTGELGFWRAAFASIVFATHAAITGGLRVPRRDVAGVVFCGLLGEGIVLFSYFSAVRIGGPVIATVLLCTAPVWVALAESARGRRPARSTVVAIVLTLAGAALVARAEPGAALQLRPDAIAWGGLAGIGYAAFIILAKPYFARYPAPTLFVYAAPLTALGFLPLAWPLSVPPLPVIAALAVLAFAAAYLGSMAFAAGLRRVDPARASVIAASEPIAAALLTFLVIGERLATFGYAGVALATLGVALVASQRTAENDADPRTSKIAIGEAT